MMFLLLVLGALGLGGRAEGWPAPVPDLSLAVTATDACERAFGPDPFGGVPSAALVAPGEVLSVDVVWAGGWKPGATVTVLACAALGGAITEALSALLPRETNDGLFVHDFQLPPDAPDGLAVCQRALVVGTSTTGAPKAERLDARCFTVVGEPSAGGLLGPGGTPPPTDASQPTGESSGRPSPGPLQDRYLPISPIQVPALTISLPRLASCSSSVASRSSSARGGPGRLSRRWASDATDID